MKNIRRLQRKFYAGPPDLGITIPRIGKYKSPTLCLFYWAYAFVQRHLTIPARGVALCCVILVPYGLVTLQIPIFLLSFLVVALFVGDFIAGMLFWPRLSVQRHTPVRIQAHSVMIAVYYLHNLSRYRRWDVAVDTLPFQGPFQFIRGRPLVNVMTGEEKMSARAEIQVGRRGKYFLPGVRADCGFPFFLWKWGKTCGYPEELLVYPAYTSLSELQLPRGMRYQAGGIAYSSQVGESTEFVGCRYFRDGDNPRHIHWRSWARTGYPVVKEFREEYLPRTALILDTYYPLKNKFGGIKQGLKSYKHSPRAFEAALSLTAAMAENLTARGFVLDFFAAGDTLYRLQSGRSLAQFREVLDILACLEASHKNTLGDVTPEFERRAGQISGLFIILMTWDEHRRRLLECLAGEGVSVRLLYFGDEDITPEDVPYQISRVSCEEILNSQRLAL